MSETMAPERMTDVDSPDPANEMSAASPIRAGRPAVERSVRVPFRTAMNYVVDAGLAMLFVAVIWLATIERFVFPAGQEAFGFRLWGLTIDDWRRYQFSALSGLSFLVVVHVTLHWNWVCCVTNTLIWRRPAGKDNGGRTLIGVGLLLLLLHLLGATVLWGRFELTAL